MAEVKGIFETQRRSDWFQDMFMAVKNNIGHHEYTWGQRALMALEVAGCEGQEMTAVEIHDTVAPYVGANREKVSGMIIYGRSRGIILKSGEKKSYRGSKRELSYDIIGHMIPTDRLLYNKPHPEPVMMSVSWE